MKLKELQKKIDIRVNAKQTLDRIENQYHALQKAILEHGANVSLEYVSFFTPTEKISFGMSRMPGIPASEILKYIGKSIDEMRHYIEMMDEDLKGIVEFEDEEPWHRCPDTGR